MCPSLDTQSPSDSNNQPTTTLTINWVKILAFCLFVILHISNLYSYPGHTCVPAQATHPDASSPHIRSCTSQEPAQFPSSPWSLSWTRLSLCFLLIPPSWPLPSLNFCSTSENQGFPLTPLVSFDWCLFSAKPGKGSQKGRSWFWSHFFFPLDWEKITVMMSRSWAFTHWIHESSDNPSKYLFPYL